MVFGQYGADYFAGGGGDVEEDGSVFGFGGWVFVVVLDDHALVVIFFSCLSLFGFLFLALRVV